MTENNDSETRVNESQSDDKSELNEEVLTEETAPGLNINQPKHFKTLSAFYGE